MTKLNLEIQELLDKFLEDRLTGEELQRFRSLAADPVNEELMAIHVEAALKAKSSGEGINADQDAIFQYILRESRRQRTEEKVIPIHTTYKTRRWMVAAAIILLAGIALTIVTVRNKVPKQSPAMAKASDLPPGKDGAILTLGDGKQVLLDSMSNGQVAVQNGAKVLLSNGRLTYTGEGGEITYNTMTVPRGRQFQLVLPDGTHVWLNSASSIRYPTVFTDKERKVDITGEIYFEVAQNAAQPFKVLVDQQEEVEVLGTHFNINAYDDEGMIRTTLLEGAVRVVANGNTAQLKPAQQAQLTMGSRLKVVDQVNVDQVMAWKNGLFNFNGSDVKTVLRQISRWYDLDIVYEAEPAPAKMMGEMQRSLSLSSVMDILKELDVKYRLEGKKLIISK